MEKIDNEIKNIGNKLSTDEIDLNTIFKAIEYYINQREDISNETKKLMIGNDYRKGLLGFYINIKGLSYAIESIDFVDKHYKGKD